MHLLETIYYSQYYELKKSGRDPQKGRINGTLLSATVIILNLMSAFFILHKVAPNSGVVQWVDHLFTGYSGTGKTLGKLIAALLLLGIGGLLWFTIGSASSYNKLAEKFMQLPENVQGKTVKQALFIFLFSFGLFLITVFIL